MSRKSPVLTLCIPKCRNCGRNWRPQEGVNADKSFCRKCSGDRKAIAISRLGLKPPRPEDFSGPYLLPRRLGPN